MASPLRKTDLFIVKRPDKSQTYKTTYNDVQIKIQEDTDAVVLYGNAKPATLSNGEPLVEGTLWYRSQSGQNRLMIYRNDKSDFFPAEPKIVGGDGIDVSLNNSNFDSTVAVDLVTDANTVGLQISSNKLGVKPASETTLGSVMVGSGLKVTAQGLLSSDIADQVTVKGTINITTNSTSDALVTGAVDGDALVNDTEGNMDAAWLALVGKSGTVQTFIGDMVIKVPATATTTGWVHIATGGVVSHDLSVGTVTDTTVDVDIVGGTTATLPAATNTLAGVITAEQKKKTDQLPPSASGYKTIVLKQKTNNNTAEVERGRFALNLAGPGEDVFVFNDDNTTYVGGNGITISNANPPVVFCFAFSQEQLLQLQALVLLLVLMMLLSRLIVRRLKFIELTLARLIMFLLKLFQVMVHLVFKFLVMLQHLGLQQTKILLVLSLYPGLNILS